MNNHRGEPLKITGEIPVSLNMLSVVNGLAVMYMKVKGLFYLVIGLTWIFFQSPSREAGLEWIDFISPQMVGVVWSLAGVISIYTAFFGSHRARRIGFFVLIVVPTIIGFYFLISWLIFITPFFDVPGYERAGISVASYWAYSASAYVMSRIYVESSGGIEDVPRGVHP